MPTQLPNFASTLQNAEANMMPSAMQRETAANRISSRIAAQHQANNRIAQNHYGAMGRSGGGGFRKALIDNASNATSGLATGLADLEQGFHDQTMQGAQNLANLGLGVGRLENDQELLQEQIRTNKQQEALDFFRSFIQGGNLNSTGTGRGDAFDTDFSNILNLIFGGMG